jgi:hypothetical protein
MVAAGTVNGQTHLVTIWSSGPRTPVEIYEGTQAGSIDYGQIGTDGPPTLSGITGFDRTRGATFNVAMPNVTWVGKQSAAPRPAAPGMHVSGQIVC